MAREAETVIAQVMRLAKRMMAYRDLAEHLSKELGMSQEQWDDVRSDFLDKHEAELE